MYGNLNGLLGKVGDSICENNACSIKRSRIEISALKNSIVYLSPCRWSLPKMRAPGSAMSACTARVSQRGN